VQPAAVGGKQADPTIPTGVEACVSTPLAAWCPRSRWSRPGSPSSWRGAWVTTLTIGLLILVASKRRVIALCAARPVARLGLHHLGVELHRLSGTPSPLRARIAVFRAHADRQRDSPAARCRGWPPPIAQNACGRSCPRAEDPRAQPMSRRQPRASELGPGQPPVCVAEPLLGPQASASRRCNRARSSSGS
jgi:hypothetical protein